tara:strand:+ start:425 stop:1024 length:600 start_codon:yes stop_codon:yes gene_type:complete
MNSEFKSDVALILVRFLGDPGLVKYLIDILEPLQRDYEEQEARKFHQSMRTTKEERWNRVRELSKQRKFHLMNSSVPVTCTLPFDGGMWRRSKQILKMVRFFRNGFMKIETLPDWNDELPGWMEEQGLKSRVDSVNLIYGDGGDSLTYRSGWCINSIEEALNDFELFEETDDEQEENYDEKPFILTYKRNEKKFLTIVN